MSEEVTDRAPVLVKDEETNVDVESGYNVEDRDQNEIDEEEEQSELELEDKNVEFELGDKRPLNDEIKGEEDEEDEDEDDEEEEEISGKRRKRRRANQFIDIEAEVDDEEEDELDEDDEEAELLREQFISDDHDREAGDAEEAQDDRLHRQFDRRRQEAEDQDAEKLAETLKQRYRRTHGVYRGDTTTSGTVSQKLLMPSINDPAIYAIRCAPGREKDLVRKLYEKKRTLSRQGKPLEILTVFQRDSFRGYIYIEAKKPEAIEKALNGMVNVYAKQKLLVPVREYPDLLKQVKSSDVDIVPGIYVRITRGKYKGDLAVVDNLSENGLDVRCKLVPRLDYGKNDEFDKEGRRVKSKIVPVPRLFNESEARLYDSENLQPGRGPRSFIYRAEEYIEGFLFKDFKLQFIKTQNVHPTLEELDRFQTGGTEDDGLDISAVAASLKSKKSGQSSAFQPGDKVEIRRGEQAKTIGKVITSSMNEITIAITNSDDASFVGQKLTVPAGDLRKVFTPGDHVKVIEGKHSEETGLVIMVENDTVVLLSDQTQEDIKVFANYLIKATDTSLNMSSVESKYDIKDLVELNASTVGVITKTEKDLFQILTSDGRLINVKPSGIASKLKLSRLEQVATDRKGFTIKIGDTVKELNSDKKREGVIIHIFKNTLFIKSNDIVENLGIFVANSMNVSTVSSKDSMISKSLGPDLTKMNPNFKAPSLASSGLKTRAGGRDKLIYKDVVVTGGNHKGLMGKVTDADDVFARIELHTKSKRIKVNKTQLSVLIRGQAIPYLRFIGAPEPTSGPTRTSGPAFSSSSGGRSAWGAGGMTPSAGSSGAGTGGSSTWGGGKTPAYNSAGAASSWGGNTGATSSWGGNNGGATAWGGNSTWKKGGASTWGSEGNNGNTSTWGSNANGSGSTWGSNKGNKSTWGSGSGSTWGSQ